MGFKRISDLNELAVGDLSISDLLEILDLDANLSKKITVASLLAKAMVASPSQLPSHDASWVTSYLTPFYTPNGTASTASITNTQMWAYPIYVPFRTTLSEIGAMVTTQQAGSTIRLALYNIVSQSNPKPGTLIVDSGNIDSASNGWRSAAINVTLDPGWYFIAIQVSNSSLVFRTLPIGHSFGWTVSGTTATHVASLQYTVTYGAFNSDLSSTDPAATGVGTSAYFMGVR